MSQKSQRRVHTSPPMRKVASLSSQHSKMLGQAASWQTVCSPSLFTIECSLVYSGPIFAVVRIQLRLALDRGLGVARLDAQHAAALGCDGHSCSLPCVRCAGPADGMRGARVQPGGTGRPQRLRRRATAVPRGPSVVEDVGEVLLGIREDVLDGDHPAEPRG